MNFVYVNLYWDTNLIKLTRWVLQLLNFILPLAKSLKFLNLLIDKLIEVLKQIFSKEMFGSIENKCSLMLLEK